MICCYARVSTNNSEQLVSLSNQIKALKEFGNRQTTEVMYIDEVLSISNGMSESLKKTIKDYKIRHLVVNRMDRLTRTVTDISFIKNNISTIYTLSDRKFYKTTLSDDIKAIMDLQLDSEKEISIMKERNKPNKKRTRDDLERLECSKKRVIIVNSLMREQICGEMLKDLANFIEKSQYLISEEDAKIISNIYFKYTKKHIYDFYKKNNYEKNNYHITKPDVITYVNDMIESKNIEINANIMKEFINALINLGKKKAMAMINNKIESDNFKTEKFKDMDKLYKKCIDKIDRSKKFLDDEINTIVKELNKL